jgi:phosphatidylserine synthase
VAVGVVVAALAIARLVYFTVRGFHLPYFLGAPTPQTALAIIATALFLGVPGFFGVVPAVFLALITVLAILMVVPVPFPKIRRGSALRPVATVTAMALAVSMLILQFRPSAGSTFYGLAELAALVAAIGIAAYYLAGPSTVPRPSGSPA